MRNRSIEGLAALALALVPATATAGEPDAAAPMTEPTPTVAVEGPPPPPLVPASANIRMQRRVGVVVMATGGVVATAGFGMTLAFTLLGDQAQRVEEPLAADIERADSLARVGGILLVSGVAVAAIGGILFSNANRKAREWSVARVHVMPTLGGVVLSGQF